jgi:hypothetical protein
MGENTSEVKIDFSVFISGLMAEGLAAMGLLQHPLAKDIKKDMRHANMVIETLAMLKAKTTGNLTPEEDKTLEEILHQLRMGYVALLKDEGKAGGGAEAENEAKGGGEQGEK